jgi:UDP-N-acetylglucosamine 2-epimerase
LVTVHRQENVDDEGRLRGIVEGLEKTRELGFEVVYPVHQGLEKV